MKNKIQQIVTDYKAGIDKVNKVSFEQHKKTGRVVLTTDAKLAYLEEAFKKLCNVLIEEN